MELLNFVILDLLGSSVSFYLLHFYILLQNVLVKLVLHRYLLYFSFGLCDLILFSDF
jgi:hypothetical protein